MRVSDVTTQFPDKVAIQALIEELKAYADSIATGNIDLSDYVTKSELQAKLDALDINIDLSSYATKEELTNAINSIDLSAYALKTEIPSLDGYATTEYVDNAIANVPTGGGNVDLSNYYTKEETDALIPSTEGLATEEYVSTAVNSIPVTDLSNYYTKDETYSKTEVDALVANSGGSSSGGSSGGASNVYSTEETAVGTWIDGSTIYRKVIEVGKLASVSSGNYGTVTTTFSDVACGELLRTTGIIKHGATTHIVVDGGFSNLQLNPSTTHSTYINNVEKSRLTLIGSSTSVKLWYGAEWGGYNYTLVVEYTKSA